MISTQYSCFVLTPTFIFSSCLFVEYSKSGVAFDSTVIQAGLTTPEIQGELLFLARNGFSLIHVLMSLNFGHGPSVSYFSFLDTLRFSNLRIECSCGDDFQILGIIISFEF